FETRIRLRIFAEAYDLNGALLRAQGKALVMRVVARKDRSSTRLEPCENLCLRFGDFLDGIEELEMHRLDCCNDGSVRPNLLTQGRDFARMVHADFEDAVFARLRHARKGEWHAPHVVVGRIRCVRCAGDAKRYAQSLFCTGLADASRDGDALGVAALAR